MKPIAQLDPAAPHPCEVLGVGVDASQDEIKKAYFAQVRAHPPERDPAAFKRIRAAYDQLNTPEKRLDADMLRLQPAPPPDPVRHSQLNSAIYSDDVVQALRAFTDLARNDWRQDWREVKP